MTKATTKPRRMKAWTNGYEHDEDKLCALQHCVPVDPPTKPGDAPLPEAAPRETEAQEMAKHCLCVCHKVGLLGLMCCPCSPVEIDRLVNGNRTQPVAPESPASTPAPRIDYSKHTATALEAIDYWRKRAESAEKLAESTPPQPGKWSKAMAEVQPCGHTNAQHLYHDSGDFPLQACSIVAARPGNIDLASKGASGRTEAQQGHVPDPASGKTGAGELPTPPQPASEALKECPICFRSVDMIVDPKAVNIGGVYYHGPCSRFSASTFSEAAQPTSEQFERAKDIVHAEIMNVIGDREAFKTGWLVGLVAENLVSEAAQAKPNDVLAGAAVAGRHEKAATAGPGQLKTDPDEFKAAHPTQCPTCGSENRDEPERKECVMMCPPENWRWVKDEFLNATDFVVCTDRFHESAQPEPGKEANVDRHSDLFLSNDRIGNSDSNRIGIEPMEVEVAEPGKEGDAHGKTGR